MVLNSGLAERKGEVVLVFLGPEGTSRMCITTSTQPAATAGRGRRAAAHLRQRPDRQRAERARGLKALEHARLGTHTKHRTPESGA